MHRMQPRSDRLPIQLRIAGGNAQEQRQVIAPGTTSGFHSDVIHESTLDLIPVDLRSSQQERIHRLLKLLPDERSTPFITCTISRHGRTLRAATSCPILPPSADLSALENVKVRVQTGCEQR